MLQIASLEIFRIIMAIMVKWRGRLQRGRAEDGNYSLTGRTEIGAEGYTAFLNVSKQLSAILCKKKKKKNEKKQFTKQKKTKTKQTKKTQLLSGLWYSG